jgi:hypothetical protein
LPKGEVIQEEFFSGTKDGDDPAEQISKAHKHQGIIAKGAPGKCSSKSLILRTCKVLARRSRESLDHVIVFHETGLRRVLRSYFEYYAHSRTHLSLEKDAPIPRAVQPPEFGRVVELREVGGLHHRYERRAA